MMNFLHHDWDYFRGKVSAAPHQLDGGAQVAKRESACTFVFGE